ncbi:sll1762 [Synechocystis sp. PCC 6803]|uniref:Sll1762 protein n=3 Tax=Synechocystis TaxID=1142 RepID=P73643_SYNY3|nr:hypothetical protein MYO_111220 [Synechocystis sp. PCC 6803]BAL28859.1 hypothetical protein SYNGTI_1112 [Synechocystis sp. PCC 6803 substr. GT-I]BAL32028.1 hypothetical protein SYNPCCN_1111 [Synechocystis sp. PCC 6803 substr. PCC-N]BAL35197.1 hypothetical protein SYNPCCP_1111 [Synechocystis sp. PCC 6803 substr. PCC-P]BAA17688.1 sll1762 [Synechocystis sp. PCC 6803]
MICSATPDRPCKPAGKATTGQDCKIFNPLRVINSGSPGPTLTPWRMPKVIESDCDNVCNSSLLYRGKSRSILDWTQTFWLINAMLKQFSATFIGLLLATVGAQAAIAETVMEKIIRTGNLTIGANLDNVPFSYINDNNEVVGYSIDIADRIREEVGKELGRDVVLQIVEVQDMSDALPKLKTGELDIVCDTAFTWERDRYVDFTVSYAVAGIQLLVPNDTPINSRETLMGRRVAMVPNTIVEDAVKIVQNEIEVVPVTSVRAGMEALKKGTVDAVAGDGIQLAGLRQVLDMPDTKVIPQPAETRYGVGCMVREDNPGFLRLANRALVRLAEGYVQGDPEDVAIVDKWIGTEGIVPVDNDNLRQFFNYLVITHEQVMEPKNGQ